MGLFWWLVANALLPVLLPFLVLLPWKLGRGHPRYDKRTEAVTSIGAAVKDGQFCLIAIAISVASIHEVLTVPGALPPWLVSTSVAQGCLCASALMAYTLSMFFRVDVDLTKAGRAWLRY